MKPGFVRSLFLSLVLTTPLMAATWTGGGSTNNWSEGANWGGTAPVAGEDLTFPDAAARKTNTNDFPDYTAFGVINFNGSGYTVGGNAVVVNGVLANPGTTTSLNVSLRLGANAQIYITDTSGMSMNGATLDLNGHGLSIYSLGNLAIHNVISGTSPSGISKLGGGITEFLGANSYVGVTAVTDGTLNAWTSTALGSTAAGSHTTVYATGTLRIMTGVTLAEDIFISDSGPGGVGALQVESGTLTGALSSAASSIRTAGGTFNFNGPLSGTGVSFAGTGLIVLGAASTLTGPMNVGTGVTVRTAADNVLSSTSDVSVASGGYLDLFGHTSTVNTLGGTGFVVLGSGTLVMRAQSSGGSFSGTMTGTGGVTVGPGVYAQRLSGSNISYTGSSLVTGAAFDASGININDVSVTSGGTLDLSANANTRNIGFTNGRLTLANGAPLGGSCLSLAMDAASTFRYALAAPAVTPDSLIAYHAVNLGGATLVLEGDFSPQPNRSFTIVDNQGLQLVLGSFNHAPGSIWTESGRAFVLAQDGGDGNDVVIRELPARGDTNFDLKTDLVWRNNSTGSNSMWFMNGLAAPVTTGLPMVGPDFAIAGIGDFQGDGKADIIWRNSTTGAVVLWLMDGGTRAASAVLTTVPPPWQIVGVGDFQGDGKDDVLWRNPSTGANAMWLLNGLNAPVSFPIQDVSDTNFVVAAVGDLQGDGKADIVWRNTSTGANVVWLMNGGSVAASNMLTPVPDQNWHIAGVGDLQGDGKADLLWRNEATGDNSVWFMTGLDAAVTASLTNVPAPWHIAKVGDFNADAKADILWRNPGSGANSMWLMNGPAVSDSGPVTTVSDTNFNPAP